MAEISLNTHNSRSKKFVSYDSLRFEKERLETFIDWPISWVKPTDLAHDGFYYLRIMDHCACIFCQGIVGAWEKGDTPRGEHQRHFPRCPFVNGQPVGNIPLEHSHIISQISPRSEVAGKEMNSDVCGTGHHIPGPSNKTYMSLEGIGLLQYSGPMRRDYLTYETRLGSYVRWPVLVKQKPKELSEAGFWYCGLSDHVRCFHCGNGLRNWETDDIPWREHARWYPDCKFVRLTKGQDFIDQVQCERDIHYQPSTSTPSSVQPTVSDQELNPLMELDIIQAMLVMGFPEQKVRGTLKRKLEQTGMPFFSLEPCIESVLQYMEEETRQTLHKIPSQSGEANLAAQALHLGIGSVTKSKDVVSNKANKVTGMTASASKPSSSSPPLDHIVMIEEPGSAPNSSKQIPGSVYVQKSTEIAEELEKIHESRMCKVCMVAEMSVVFLPCTHMVTCISCSLAITQCPICREDIKYTIKPILS